MKEYEIWIEGYAVTGNSARASFIGKANGITFKKACENFRYPSDIYNEYTNEIIIKKGSRLQLDKDREYPSIWACRLFDNEADARKSFG